MKLHLQEIYFRFLFPQPLSHLGQYVAAALSFIGIYFKPTRKQFDMSRWSLN